MFSNPVNKLKRHAVIFDVGLGPDVRLLGFYEILAGKELSRRLNIKSWDKAVEYCITKSRDEIERGLIAKTRVGFETMVKG